MNIKELRQNLLPRLRIPSQLPVELTYGGKPMRGDFTAWNPRVHVRQTEDGIEETVVVCTSPEGLELRLVCREDSRHAAVEYAACLTNRSDVDSPLVETVRMVGEIPGSGAALYHGNGDTLRDDGYEWWMTPVTAQPLTLEPCGDGTSCNGAFPYMRLMLADCGVNLAVGWSGTWTAEFVQSGTHTVCSVGQKRCRMVIHPGETMMIPSVTMVAYAGGEEEGCNTWRRWYFDRVIPKEDGKPLRPLCCMHLFQAQGKPEFTGATEENQLAAMDAYLSAGIHPDVWWIDAGWYPCGEEWHHTGDWRANPENFPHGLSPIGERCKAENIKFLLWFEPERIRKGSVFEQEHPEWLLYPAAGEQPFVNCLVDLGNRACCDYVIALLDGLIKDSGVEIYRQDFNFSASSGSAGEIWQLAEESDRIGARENLHIQGYYRLWDTLLANNPGLLIDSCASGGRRNDLETMRRSVTLHYTDVGYGHHPIKLKQHRQMYEWIPYFRAHNENWCAEDGSYDKTGRKPDRYSYYAAMTPALTDITAWDAGEEALAMARELQPVWRAAAERMIGTDYYPLTVCRKSSGDFYAAQFHDAATETGILHMLNGSQAKETEFVVRMKGLKPEQHYILRSAEQKRTWTVRGADLMNGMAVTMEQKTGDVWFYEKA